MIRVAVADDHHLVREGIRALLERATDIEVVGEATDGAQAVDLIQRLAPDVLVVDIAMPGLNGIQALERIGALRVATQVVILSMYSDEALVRQALHHGARGYLLKGSVSEELLLAVRAAARGAAYLSPAVSDTLRADRLGADSGAPPAGRLPALSPREREILDHVSQGQTNSQMATRMGISIKTVERHRTKLMAKLGANSVVDLVRIAIRQGLIRLEDA
jgi:DNA-binding NarL/FixJ family response regulator